MPKLKTVYDAREGIQSLDDAAADLRDYLGRVEDLDDAVQEVIDEVTETAEGWLVPHMAWQKMLSAHVQM